METKTQKRQTPRVLSCDLPKILGEERAEELEKYISLMRKKVTFSNRPITAAHLLYMAAEQDVANVMGEE